MLTKKFLVCYAGEVEYDVAGVVYNVRYWGNPDGAWNEGVWDKFIEPRIGTVAYRSLECFHEFPPRDVVALFPGCVGARYTEDWAVEYDGAKPIITASPKVPCYRTAQQLIDAGED